jgi:hypothetical protein
MNEITRKDLLAGLRTRAAERKPHGLYLAKLEYAVKGHTTDEARYEAAATVERPEGVSARYADALVDDLLWILGDDPEPPARRAVYERNYATLRDAEAQRSYRAQQTKKRNQDSLGHLLRIKKDD